MLDVTVVTPTIPPRAEQLQRAVASVMAQTLPAAALAIACDVAGAGAPVTRQRALEMVRTEWTAFLDDDDEFLPEHLQVLADGQAEVDADYVFSYYTIIDNDGNRLTGDPVLGNFGRVFDNASPHQTTTVVLVRTELARQARCDNKIPEWQIHGQRAGEDFMFTLRCVELGAKILHVPRRTWLWRHSAHPVTGNTSGRPWNQREIWG